MKKVQKELLKSYFKARHGLFMQEHNEDYTEYEHNFMTKNPEFIGKIINMVDLFFKDTYLLIEILKNNPKQFENIDWSDPRFESGKDRYGIDLIIMEILSIVPQYVNRFIEESPGAMAWWTLNNITNLLNGSDYGTRVHYVANSAIDKIIKYIDFSKIKYNSDTLGFMLGILESMGVSKHISEFDQEDFNYVNKKINFNELDEDLLNAIVKKLPKLKPYIGN